MRLYGTLRSRWSAGYSVLLNSQVYTSEFVDLGEWLEVIPRQSGVKASCDVPVSTERVIKVLRVRSLGSPANQGVEVEESEASHT